jgi:signal transduction histidine kinase
MLKLNNHDLRIPARQLAAINKRLARKAIKAQEEERLRVSQELHDGACQALTALKLKLEMIQENLSSEPEQARAQMTLAIALTDQAAEEVRGVAYRLRPPILDLFDFNSALEGCCLDFAQGSKCKVTYLGERIELPNDVEVSLYRFLQEGLANIAKHANAKNVSVSLHGLANEVRLTVQDDGRGFSLPEEGRQAGLGLLTARERVEILGGWVEIDTAPGTRTTLTAHIPR